MSKPVSNTTKVLKTSQNSSDDPSSSNVVAKPKESTKGSTAALKSTVSKAPSTAGNPPPRNNDPENERASVLREQMKSLNGYPEKHTPRTQKSGVDQKPGMRGPRSGEDSEGSESDEFYALMTPTLSEVPTKDVPPHANETETTGMSTFQNPPTFLSVKRSATETPFKPATLPSGAQEKPSEKLPKEKEEQRAAIPPPSENAGPMPPWSFAPTTQNPPNPQQAGSAGQTAPPGWNYNGWQTPQNQTYQQNAQQSWGYNNWQAPIPQIQTQYYGQQPQNQAPAPTQPSAEMEELRRMIALMQSQNQTLMNQVQAQQMMCNQAWQTNTALASNLSHGQGEQGPRARKVRPHKNLALVKFDPEVHTFSQWWDKFDRQLRAKGNHTDEEYVANMLSWMDQKCFDGWFPKLTPEQQEDPEYLLSRLRMAYPDRISPQDKATNFFQFFLTPGMTVHQYTTQKLELYSFAFPFQTAEKDAMFVSAYRRGFSSKFYFVLDALDLGASVEEIDAAAKACEKTLEHMRIADEREEAWWKAQEEKLKTEKNSKGNKPRQQVLAIMPPPQMPPQQPMVLSALQQSLQAPAPAPAPAPVRSNPRKPQQQWSERTLLEKAKQIEEWIANKPAGGYPWSPCKYHDGQHDRASCPTATCYECNQKGHHQVHCPALIGQGKGN